MDETSATTNSMYLEAAKGWCELHAFLEANDELEEIAPQFRAHPLVLEARWQVYANLEKWEGALEIAGALVEMKPDWPNGWIYKASSLSGLNRQNEAYQTLKAAARRFPHDEIICYGLACICCRVGASCRGAGLADAGGP